jgi:hypothetical protein
VDSKAVGRLGETSGSRRQAGFWAGLPTRTMEFSQAVNRPSPIPAHVTFCVQTVNTPVFAKHSMRVRYNFGTTEGEKERLTDS